MDLSKLITKEMKDEKLLETVLSIKLQELLEEKNNRVDAAVGTSDPRKKDMKIAKPISLLLKKIKGTITPEQETELSCADHSYQLLRLLYYFSQLEVPGVSL